MRMTVDNLHPDIRKDNDAIGRKVVEVIDPSPGVWGGDPIEGLVTLVYECNDTWCHHDVTPATFSANVDRGKHTHHAIYGPKDEKSAESGYTCYAD